MSARWRVLADRQLGDGITALMYAAWSKSTSRIDPVESSLYDVTCAGSSHVCS